MIAAWLMAARLRTLPLALASIILAGFLAADAGLFNTTIWTLAVLTTVFLQVLSNFANDYGDSASGIDNATRTVAVRAVQTGVISPKQMKNGMILMGILALVSGISLLAIALQTATNQERFGFLLLGILAIIAAVAYTVGKRPYGYVGLGDIAVLVFFGWVGVFGTFYLLTKSTDLLVFLPATTCGLFAVGVLNINNIRDIENDRRHGKYSIPVRLGMPKAKLYQWALVLMGIVLTCVYLCLTDRDLLAWVGVGVPSAWLVRVCMKIQQGKTPADFDPFLKQMALGTLAFVLGLGLCL